MKKCPRCGGVYSDYPALSRVDNKTDICSPCGTEEAIQDFTGEPLSPLSVDEGLVHHGIKCRSCNETHWVDVTKDQLDKYNNKQGLIQDIFPELTPDLRELFVSKTCGDCWDEMFNDIEEEEE